MHRLWTIRIRGSGFFSGVFEGNPQIVHEGGDSVHHQMLTEDEAEFLVEQISSMEDLEAFAWTPEGQTPEQEEERQKYLNQQDRVWPHISCPQCPWFDLLEDSFPCGLVAWPEESVDSCLDTSSLHRSAKEACPVDRPQRG